MNKKSIDGKLILLNWKRDGYIGALVSNGKESFQIEKQTEFLDLTYTLNDSTILEKSKLTDPDSDWCCQFPFISKVNNDTFDINDYVIFRSIDGLWWYGRLVDYNTIFATSLDGVYKNTEFQLSDIETKTLYNVIAGIREMNDEIFSMVVNGIVKHETEVYVKFTEQKNQIIGNSTCLISIEPKLDIKEEEKKEELVNSIAAFYNQNRIQLLDKNDNVDLQLVRKLAKEFVDGNN